MRVDWITLCKDARMEDGMLTLVGVSVDAFEPERLPASVPVVVAARVVGARDEHTANHRLGLTLLDPELQPTCEHEIGFRFPGEDAPVPPGWESGVTLAERVELIFPSPGAYLLQVMLDGETDRALPIKCRL